MAYKQKGFPQHISTIDRSPAQGWDWWDENVQDQGYGGAALSGASTGASIGSMVPGIGTAVGAVVGGLVGIGAQAFENDAFSSDDNQTPAEPRNYGFDPDKKPVWSGNGDKTHWEQQVLNPWLEKKADLDYKSSDEFKQKEQERWQGLTDKRNYNKTLETNIERGLNNPELMAKAQHKAKLKSEGRYNPNPAKPVDQSKTHLTNWNEMLKKSSPAPQLTPPNRGGRPMESNALNPMSSTLSALNGSDSTNLAVKYNQFNNIAQNLDEGLQSDNT